MMVQHHEVVVCREQQDLLDSVLIDVFHRPDLLDKVFVAMLYRLQVFVQHHQTAALVHQGKSPGAGTIQVLELIWLSAPVKVSAQGPCLYLAKMAIFPLELNDGIAVIASTPGGDNSIDFRAAILIGIDAGELDIAIAIK